MESERQFIKQRNRLLRSAYYCFNCLEADQQHYMVVAMGIITAMDRVSAYSSVLTVPRMVGKKMIQTIIQLLANNPALFKDCEHRVCDARLAFRRKHGKAKKMRKAK